MEQAKQFDGERVVILNKGETLPLKMPNYLICSEDVEGLLDRLPDEPIFDLVITSPPYNIGKDYEVKALDLENYRMWQKRIIGKVVKRLKPTGAGEEILTKPDSTSWRVGAGPPTSV